MTGAYIISKYTGSYINFVQERIFKPLGMDSTTYSPQVAKESGEFTQSWTSRGRRIPNWFSESSKGRNAGPGGITTSVVDLVRSFNSVDSKLTYELLTFPRPSG